MDFLRRLLLGLMLWSMGVQGDSVESPTMIREFAVRALMHCDASRSRYLSDALTKSDAALGALYRLSWISLLSQTGKTVPRSSWTAPLTLEEKSIAWRASSEIWKDEWKGLSMSPQCQPDTQGFIPSADEALLIKDVLAPWTKAEIAVPPALEDSLLTLAYNAWLEGDKLALGAVKTEGPLACQWRARDFVQAQSISGDEVTRWQKQCSACQGRFCFVVKLQLADQQVARQEFKPALAAYVDLAHAIDDIPATLAYRVTALQLMAARPIENLLRSSAPLFADESEDVPSAQKETIRSGICERLANEKGPSIKAVFSQVYPKKDVVRQFRSWLLTCDLGLSEAMARKFMATGLSQTEKEMIGQSLQTRQAREKLNREKLAREAKKNASETVHGVAPREKSLPGTLKIPLLLPFPEMSYPEGPYQFTVNFLKVAGAK